VLLLGDEKVALVGDQRDVGEEEAERTLPEATALAFPRRSSVDSNIVQGAAACLLTAEIFYPEAHLSVIKNSQLSALSYMCNHHSFVQLKLSMKNNITRRARFTVEF
jgi:hypothetical protein